MAKPNFCPFLYYCLPIVLAKYCHVVHQDAVQQERLQVSVVLEIYFIQEWVILTKKLSYGDFIAFKVSAFISTDRVWYIAFKMNSF